MYYVFFQFLLVANVKTPLKVSTHSEIDMAIFLPTDATSAF